MSRNIEKSSSVLVRYQELKAEEEGGFKDYSRYKRPKRIGSVKNLKDALEWRKQVAKEISEKVTRIYDVSLNDWKIEELNNELNELTRERNRWDWHIQKVLGGSRPRNHGVINGKLISGKRYFGRALDLPEVQKLLRGQAESKRNNVELVNMRLIPDNYDDDYYGAGENPSMPEFEQFESSWTIILREHYNKKDNVECNALNEYDNVPNLKEIERWLVERRKQKLLKELGF